MAKSSRGRGPVIVGLTLLLLGTGAGVAAGDFGPWSVDARHPVVEETSSRGEIRPSPPSPSPFGFAFMVWSNLLTRIDGPRCAHHPSCGTYARRALARHGVPLGLWMALARVTRGAYSSALRTLPRITTRAGVFFLDRIEDNRFWERDYLPISGR